MVAKRSLAEKYALRKSQTIDNQNTLLDAISSGYILPQMSAKNTQKNISPRKLLAEKYESRNIAKSRDLKIPGAFGLPIKRVYMSPLRSRDIAPLQLYKISKSPRNYPPKRILAMNHLADYKVGKKTSTGTRVGQLARRITGFLASLSAKPPSVSKKSELSQSRNTELELENERRQDFGSLETTRTLDFPRELAKASLSKPVLEDIDEVDLTIRENKHRQEQRQLENEKRKLERQLLTELQLAQEIKEKYERKLYLQQRDYEAQLHALKEEARTRSTIPSTHVHEELEADQTFSEITLKDRTRKNETLLVQQSRLQEELEERSRVLAEKEAIIALRERELIDKSYKLSEKLTSPRENFVAYREFTPNKTPFTLQFEKQKEEKLMVAQTDISQKIKDKHVVSMCEDVKRIMLVLTLLKLVSDTVKQEMLVALRQAEKELQNTKPAKQSTTLNKVLAVQRFLDDFDGNYKKSPENAEYLYNAEKLEGIMDALRTLRAHSEDKSRARVRQIKKYDRQLTRLGPPTLFCTQAEMSKCVSSTLFRAQAVVHQRNLAHAQEQMCEALRMVDTVRRKLGPELEIPRK